MYVLYRTYSTYILSGTYTSLYNYIVCTHTLPKRHPILYPFCSSARRHFCIAAFLHFTEYFVPMESILVPALLCSALPNSSFPAPPFLTKHSQTEYREHSRYGLIDFLSPAIPFRQGTRLDPQICRLLRVDRSASQPIARGNCNAHCHCSSGLRSRHAMIMSSLLPHGGIFHVSFPSWCFRLASCFLACYREREGEVES